MQVSAVKVASAMMNLVPIKVFLAFVAIFLASFLFSQNASASMGTNSRLHYGNASNYCYAADNGPGYFAKGMVWLSNNESDYYSESVNVATNANSVSVSIRGAVNTCRTTFDATTEMWAINVSTSFLSGLSGNSFWRGNVPGRTTFAWSSAGSKLYGNLNVRGIAVCNAASLQTGYAQQTISIGITRQQMQQRPGYYWVSPTVGTEWVPVTVTRTCPSFNYSLTPTITNVPVGLDGQAIESESGVRNVIGRVTNNGPTPSRPNVAWQLTELIYRPGSAIPNRPAASSGSSPCDYFRAPTNYSCNETSSGASTATKGTEAGGYAYPNNNTYSRLSTIGAVPAGTRICYAMSVKPRAHNSENWQHSALHCYVISKMPKVQIRGGDLIAGRGSSATTMAVRTSVTTRSSGESFGSWSEYAIASNGRVSGAASGSGYQGGSAEIQLCQRSLSLLTFNNTTATGTCGLGGYVNAPTSPAAAVSQYFGRLSSQNATGSSVAIQNLAANSVHRLTNAAATINVSSSGDVPAGKWVVLYAPSKTVVVRSNITYTNGAITDVSRIPQVVIIANKIVIADSVERVDAWLVTPSATGVINTCGVGASANETANPTTRVCERRLQVNGPVMTDQLLLRRTFGSEAGAGAGEPAEIFNLRPDAHLWMTSLQGGSKALTVSSKELPPRF